MEKPKLSGDFSLIGLMNDFESVGMGKGARNELQAVLAALQPGESYTGEHNGRSFTVTKDENGYSTVYDDGSDNKND